MIIVITGTTREFEEYCMINGLTRKTAIELRQPEQLAFYPDLPVVFYGTHWLNAVTESQALRDHNMRLMQKQIHGLTLSQEFEDFWREHAVMLVGKAEKDVANYVWNHIKNG